MHGLSLWRRLPATSASPGPRLTVQDLWHRYPGMAPDAWTLQGLSLTLGQGELVGLLGPSGCGKTTLLRLIAGFETPARGSICLDGRQVAGPQRWLPPESRGVGMVFQDYALFPHLDAWQNACFGLTPARRGQAPGAVLDRERVGWLLELMGLGGLEHRYPHELSGGQRQRLALVRALAPGTSLLLLDEPFSNLDVEVRLRLRSELPEVLSRCGASGLLITHDPEEAMAICDRVAVMQAGVIHQCGPPNDLLVHPATPFVGRFVLQGNSLPAHLEGSQVRTSVGNLEMVEALPGPSRHQEPCEVLILPEGLAFVPDPEGEAWVLGREFLGQDWAYRVQWREQRLRLRLPLELVYSRGQRGWVRLHTHGSGWFFPGGHRLQAAPCSSPP